jgi:hypothetical protein
VEKTVVRKTGPRVKRRETRGLGPEGVGWTPSPGGVTVPLSGTTGVGRCRSTTGVQPAKGRVLYYIKGVE